MTHGHQFGITIIVARPSMYLAIIAARSSVRHPYARHTGTPSQHVYHNGTAIYEAQLLVAWASSRQGHHCGMDHCTMAPTTARRSLRHTHHCGTQNHGTQVPHPGMSITMPRESVQHGHHHPRPFFQGCQCACFHCTFRPADLCA